MVRGQRTTPPPSNEKAVQAAAMKVFAGEVDLEKSEVAPQGLHGKLAHIMANVGSMEKAGFNKNQHYKYWSDEQISGYFRSIFGRLNIVFQVEVESFDIREHATAKEGRSFLTTALYRFTLIDVETGEKLSGTMLGQGDDPGDKGANKAATGASKYWLLKTFLIGGEDAEADEKTDQRAERSAERKPVRVGPSLIEGIQRGGRSSKATDVQIRQIRELAVDLGWKNAVDIAKRLSEWTEDAVDLSDTPPEDQGPSLLRWLESLSSEDTAKIINGMIEMRDEATDGGHEEQPVEPSDG